jgi:choline-sulfatase
VRYITYPAQLFDRQADPEELRDVAGDPAYAAVLRRMEEALRARLDPALVDARAKRRQAEILAANGGWAEVSKRGDLPYSPPPGVPPNWS